MSDLYGSEAERINSLISSNKQLQLDNLGSMLSEEQQSNLAGWKEKADEFAHKYTALAEGGGAEIAGALGLEGGYKAVKKIKGLYDNVQKRKSALKQKQQQDAENALPDESNLNDDPEGFPSAEEARSETTDLRQSLSDRFSGKATETRIKKLTEAEDSPPDDAGFRADAEATRDQADQALKDRQESELASGDTPAEEGGTADIRQSLSDRFQSQADDTDIANLTKAEAEIDPFSAPAGGQAPAPAQPAPAQPEAVADVDAPAEQAGARFSTTYSSAVDPETALSRTVASQNISDPLTIRVNRLPDPAKMVGREFATDEGGGTVSQNIVVSSDPAVNPFARTAQAQAQQAQDAVQQAQQAGGKAVSQAQDAVDQAQQAGSQALAQGNQAVDQAVSTGRDVVNTANQTISEGKTFLQGQLENLQARGRSIRQGFQNVKDFVNKTPSELEDLGTQATKTVATTAGEVGGEAGGELAGMATTDAVLGAVPVVGELALGITGLVSIGEGLYHLFHHKDTPPPAPTLPQVHLATSNPSAGLTQKFASSLPSLDSSAEPSASSMSF